MNFYTWYLSSWVSKYVMSFLCDVLIQAFVEIVERHLYDERHSRLATADPFQYSPILIKQVDCSSKMVENGHNHVCQHDPAVFFSQLLPL